MRENSKEPGVLGRREKIFEVVSPEIHAVISLLISTAKTTISLAAEFGPKNFPKQVINMRLCHQHECIDTNTGSYFMSHK